MALAGGNSAIYRYDVGGGRVCKRVDSRQTVAVGAWEGSGAVGEDGAWTRDEEFLAISDGVSVVLRVETSIKGTATSSAQRFELADQVNSRTVYLDGAGGVLGRREYLPYGAIALQSWSGTAGGGGVLRWGFGGKRMDGETGLLDFGARMYAPWLGRWTAVDPVVDLLGSAYGYCRGSPVSLVDPDGREGVKASNWKRNTLAFFDRLRNIQEGKVIRGRKISVPRAGAEAQRPQLRQGPSAERQRELDDAGAKAWAEREAGIQGLGLVSSLAGIVSAVVTLKVTGSHAKAVAVGEQAAAFEAAVMAHVEAPRSSDIRAPGTNRPSIELVERKGGGGGGGHGHGGGGNSGGSGGTGGGNAPEATLVNPKDLRWSQTTAGGRGRAAQIRQSMAEHGWSGPPIDVVETPDGLVTLDHTRAAVALERGMTEVPVRIHQPGDALPTDMLNRPWNRAGDTATTWGEAARLRGAGQTPPIGPTGTPKPPRLP